jgi:tetratricopeptide (TPR) repeat protein
MRNSYTSVDKTYDGLYKAPTWSPERSLTVEMSLLQIGNAYYMDENWEQVIKCFDNLPADTKNKFVFDFYRGVSYQNLEKYKESIAEYTKVINHGDNMYVEEAQWFRSLCYMQLGNFEKANMELLAVIERKGHYENDAKAVIRRLKYSFK